MRCLPLRLPQHAHPLAALHGPSIDSIPPPLLNQAPWLGIQAAPRLP